MSARQNEDLTVNELRALTRMKICEKLNIPRDGKDFKTFAGKINMPNDRIAVISRRDDPTEEILRWWEPKTEATVKNLRRILKQMDRHDILKILDEDSMQGNVNQQEVANTTSTDGVDTTDNMTEREIGQASTENNPNHPKIQLMEMKDIKPTKIEWSEATKDPIDVLLVVVKKIEFRAAYQILTEPKSADSETDLGKVYFGQIGKNNVALVRSSMGDGGNAGMQMTCLDGIAKLKPKNIISVGVCFGMDTSRQKLGDVVVSTKLACYDPGRENSDGSSQFRGTITECKPRIKNLFRDGETGWEGQNGVMTDVHFDLMISGSKLVDYKDFKEKLMQQFPTAIGGEMEGGGLQRICDKNNLPWIVCKAISDWGDGTKNKKNDKKWQPFAAVMAASYVQHVLTEFHVPGEEGNGSGQNKRPPDQDEDEVDAGPKRRKTATKLKGQPKWWKVEDINTAVHGELCQQLNIHNPGRDYIALAGEMGYNKKQTDGFALSDNPANALLKNWQPESGHDVPQLIKHLREIKRHDLIELLEH